MRNFFKVATGVDVLPITQALAARPDLWNAIALRTTYPDSPHGHVDDILLRFNEIGENPIDVANDRECINYPALAELPQVRPIIFDLMRRVEGERLGRVMITRLAPGKMVMPHEDAGAPAEYYRRYHVALQWLPGCIFRCGDEEVNPNTGDVWYFNNRLVHSVVNNSADDRITMIVDIR